MNKIKLWITGAVAGVAPFALAAAAHASTITAGDFTLPTTTPTDMLASVSAVVTDPGLLSVAVIAVALPLAFWVIHQLIGLLPKSRARRN